MPKTLTDIATKAMEVIGDDADDLSITIHEDVLTIQCSKKKTALDTANKTAPIQPPSDPNSLPGQIIEIIRASATRMTCDQVMSAFAGRGISLNEPRMKYTLAAMVSLGHLTHEKKKNPRGYGIPGVHD